MECVRVDGQALGDELAARGFEAGRLEVLEAVPAEEALVEAVV